MRRTFIVTAGLFYAGVPLVALAQHEGHGHAAGGHDPDRKPSARIEQPATGGEHDHSVHTHDREPRKPESKVSAVKQTICPVSGRPVKPDVSTGYHDFTVNFCSSECIRQFEKSPLTYLPAFYKQVYPQHVQVTCPVMGGEIDLAVSIEHKGQKIYFCCDGCDKKFKKDSAKYEDGLRDAYTQQVHCPVTGKAISPAYQLDGKNGVVYFCSEPCRDKFSADKAYAPAALPTLGVLAAGPTTGEDIVMCAVEGEVAERAKMQPLVYKDHVYFAHSETCTGTFKTEPAKYARQIQETIQRTSSRRSSAATSMANRGVTPGCSYVARATPGPRCCGR